MRYLKPILLLLLLALPFMLRAQEVKYTDQLKRQGTGGATVVVHQDAEMEALLFSAEPSAVRDTAKVKKPEITQGRHTKDTGFRVQIFMAGNTAQDKNTVKSWARRFKSHFPTVNAYVYFIAPHWVCQAGDFKSREDASKLLADMRSVGGFTSASVVRAKINMFEQTTP